MKILVVNVNAFQKDLFICKDTPDKKNTPKHTFYKYLKTLPTLLVSTGGQSNKTKINKNC